MQAAGALDRRLTIRRRDAHAVNHLGEPIESWPVVATVWASRQDVSDGERAAAGASLATLRTRFVVRSSSVTRAVTNLDRLTCDGRTWAVVSIKQIGRRDALEWTADARTEG